MTWEVFLSQIAVGGITAVIASWFAVQFALKRFVSEKWWEKKAEAYSAILESLHYMKRHYSELIDDEVSVPKLSEARKDELAKASIEAEDKLKKQIDIGQFVLSDEAVAELSTFQKAYGHVAVESWLEYVEYRWVAIDAALKQMRAIAKTDLKGR